MQQLQLCEKFVMEYAGQHINVLYLNGRFFFQVKMDGFIHTIGSFIVALNLACYHIKSINDGITMRLDCLAVMDYGTPHAKNIPSRIIENGIEYEFYVFEINNMPWD